MATEIISVSGLHCHGCDMNVEDTIKELPGIKKVKGNFNEGTVKVEFDESKTSTTAIREKIREAGYKDK